MRHLSLALLILMGSFAVGAQDFNLPPGKWWENERLAERIGLTDEQKGAIRDLVFEHAHRMIDLHADVKRAELELASLVAAPDFENPAARTAFAGLVEARATLEKERFEMLLAVRGVLTAEQWLQIQEIRREFRRNRDRPQGGQRPFRPPNGG